MTRVIPTPKHLWAIGIVSLLWNAMGAYDYLMTQTHNEAYMAKFDQAQLDYFYNFPVWFEAFWALAVWGGIVGSALLLMRKQQAVPVFLGSLLAMVITAIYNFGFSNGMEMMGTTGFVFTIVIFLFSVGLWFYSRAMKSRGILV